MSAPVSFRAVIDLWGTREACASEIGTNAARVSKWWQRNNIPAEWWEQVLATATAKAAGLTAGIFTTLAARAPAAAEQLVEARP